MQDRGTVEVRLEDVDAGYGGEVVLRGVNLVLRGPGLIQVLGPNGAGKTTLLRVMLGLLRPMRGRVLVNGVDVTGRPELAGRFAGYVPQLEPGSRHFPLTAWEVVETECLVRCRRWPRLIADAEARRSAEEALERVGLPREAWGRPLHRLSGGQRQRVLIARALVHRPRLLVMDEPLSAVDPAGKREIARLIESLAEESLVVMTSHDPMLLLHRTDAIVLVNRGIVAYGAPSEVLRAEILEKVYGAALVEVERHLHIVDEHAAYPRR